MNFIKPYPSENRAVLHTATRDFFDHPQTADKSERSCAVSAARD